MGGRRGLAIIITVLILVCIVVSVDVLVSILCSRSKSGGGLDEYRGLAMLIQRIYDERPRELSRDYIQSLNNSLEEYDGFIIMDVGVYEDGGEDIFYIVYRNGEKLIIFIRPAS